MIPGSMIEESTRAELLQWLQQTGQRPATFSSLVDLYGLSQDRFYQLACIGLPSDAPLWAKEIAELAAIVRHFVRSGFQLDEASKEIIGSDKSLYLGNTEFPLALHFLRQLSGVAGLRTVGRDYSGVEVSSAEVRFNVGTPEESELDKAQSAAKSEIKPRVLRVDHQDMEAVRNGMPGYAVYELLQCAPRVVQAPTVIFQGIRWKGRLRAGKAYCGKPRRAFASDGRALQIPSGMIYCVYVDPDGFVFDWDWTQEDRARPGYPMDYRVRFVNQITDLNEAVLLLPSDLVPGSFKKSKAWHSSRGDCMFFYASDARAYAKRVNDDLTEYRGIDSDQLVGCKVKNFEELLSKVVRSPRSPSVPVSAVLAASLVRQMDSHQQREKGTFLKLIFETALRMDEKRRQEFFKAVVQLDDQAERYLQNLCDMVLEFTEDRAHPVLEYATQILATRQAIEEPYMRLITAAGNTSVAAQAVGAA